MSSDPAPLRPARPAALRRQDILEQVERQGGAHVADLANHFGVSQMTIHRDLSHLAAEGLVQRVRGGAASVPSRTREAETDFMKRRRRAHAAKRAIANVALSFARDDSIVFLDSSTTTLALAHRLQHSSLSRLTIVTNSPAIAYELSAPTIQVIVTPGDLDQELRMIGGSWAEEFVRGLKVETAFVSGVGLSSEYGLMTAQRGIADLLHAVRAVSSQVVALVDSGKLGIQSLLPIARLDELHAIVTDASPQDQRVAELRSAGAQLVFTHDTVPYDHG